jgi:hypothetical protein
MIVALFLLALTSLVDASPAFAHGLGQGYDLPIPLWLFLYGAAAAVLVSFVPVSLLADKGRVGKEGPYGYPRFDLLKFPTLRAALTNRPLLLGLRLLSVALFLLVILSGLFGQQNPSSNFAPTFVWITWWVGFSFFTAFVGNLWPLVNPWKILFEWAEAFVRRLDPKSSLELGISYPAVLGVWPAVLLYTAFVWLEVTFEGSAEPKYLAFFALVYACITWSGMVVFGKGAWLKGGEAFSVFFGLLARFAPTEVRVKRVELCEACGICESVEGECVNCYECLAKVPPEDRELNLRPPAVGLGRPDQVPEGGAVFVVLVLAGVTYDGLVVTPLWLRLQDLVPVSETLGLVAVPLLFLAVYLVFVKLSQLLGRGTGRLGRFAAAYVYSLVPIAIAYQVAHYFTVFLAQGQRIVHLVSDPFGWGWNLLGTAGYGLNATIVQADVVWYSQVALIVAGHIIAVYLAHLIALRLLQDPRRVLKSQLPMLALMVLYTVFSLWILSQPVVEETKVAQAPPEEVITTPPEDVIPPPPESSRSLPKADLPTSVLPVREPPMPEPPMPEPASPDPPAAEPSVSAAP